MIKKGCFINIQPFMVQELKLKGNELLVYAIIHSYSQGKEGYYKGSISYLCEWTNATKQGILKVLKSLYEKGLLEKKKVGNYVFYQANTDEKSEEGEQSLPNEEENEVNKVYPNGKQSLPEEVNKVYPNGKQSLPEEVNKVYPNGKQSLPNNKEIRKFDNKEIRKFDNKEIKSLPQEAKDLAQYLYNSCKEKDPYFKRTEKQLEKWADEFDLIHRKDGREWSQIEAVLKWARSNDFWRKNILSAGKFREKFERLYAGMIDDKPSQNYQQKPSVNLEGKIFF